MNSEYFLRRTSNALLQNRIQKIQTNRHVKSTSALGRRARRGNGESCCRRRDRRAPGFQAELGEPLEDAQRQPVLAAEGGDCGEGGEPLEVLPAAVVATQGAPDRYRCLHRTAFPRGGAQELFYGLVGTR